MPGRRGTLLVLLGAALAAVVLTVGVLTQGGTPAQTSASTPTSDPAPPMTIPVTSPAPASHETTPATPRTEAAGSTAPPPTSVPAGRGAAADFRAVAGPACPADPARGTRSSNGWQVIPGDSWTGDGCADRFLYAAPDDSNYLEWLFTFDAPGMRKCRIAVYVPDSPLAASPVWYGVADRVDNPEYRVGGFTVDQQARRGDWVTATTVSLATEALLIHVDGQGPTGVAAGPLRVSCTPQP